MYAIGQDMIDRYGTPRMTQLTDINEPLTGAVVQLVLDRALSDASAEIDGYLVGRMALPLANPPEILRVHCCTIALYRLLGSGVDEATAEAYKLALAYLGKVADGRITLQPPGDVPAMSGVGSVLFDEGFKVMGRESDGGRGRW